ncbi:MAG: cytochrome o ubiquinol oxidase subunit III [Pseudomonadota bacterium]
MSATIEARAGGAPSAPGDASGQPVPPPFDFHVVESGDHGDEHHDNFSMLGFWIYLMSDCLIFGILFAVHAVVGQRYAAGPSPADLFEIEMILVSTFMLLLSSITFGFAVLKMHEGKVRGMTVWLLITFVFGLAFLVLEVMEFTHLWHRGATPTASAFLSSFYFLVGTHGLHVTVGCIWLCVLLAQVHLVGLTPANRDRMLCLSLFWHFLDLIWIGVFSFVYLAGVLL